MTNEETIEFYKNLNVHPVGIPKSKIPYKADINMTDAELVAFYSERYADIDVEEFLLKDRKERLYGLCNLIKEGEFYLDIGCANGGHMEILHQRGINGIGLDLSVPNIMRGREKYPHLKFVHGFAEEIPFKDDYFDVVILGDAIEHFRGPKATIAECLRVVKKGLAICIPIKEEVTEEHINPFTDQKILDLLEFYKLKISFFNYDGIELTKEDASKELQNFLWLLIRAEKTAGTDIIVKETLDNIGKELEKRSKEEILDNDQWTKDLGHNRHETEIARFKLVSHLIEGNNVLEIGCGNGDGSIEMAKNGFDVTGIDISGSGIVQATDIANKENVMSKTKFFVMDATRLSFPDNSFDSVVIPEVLEHIRSSRKLLEEVFRVIRNGGRIIISVPDGLLIPWEGHLRVFFNDTLTTELSQYTTEIEYHKLSFKKWIICSFFVKKKELDIKVGPLVDIMMSTFNGRKTIEKAIKSIIGQTYQNWNLIVVNDGGDDVSDIIKEFSNHRIKYICTENKGKSHALNVGIKNSNGKYVTYLDDDDILYPIHIEVLVKTALDKRQDFVYTDWYEVSIDENHKESKREIQFRLDVTPSMLIFQNYINHKCILHNRSLIKEVGTYDEDLDILIDWDMIRRLAFACKPYHIWCFTSERILYYNKGVLQNRITGLWTRDPYKVSRSMENIVKKTVGLHASPEELEEAVIQAMLSMSYYNSLKLNSELQVKDTRITELNNTLQVKDTRITELNNTLQVKDTRITELNNTLQVKDTRITELNNTLQVKDTRITELNNTLQVKDTRITELNNTLQVKDTRITELNNTLQVKDTRITELNTSLQSMRQSIVWRSVMMFHTGIIEKLLPYNTRRRRFYDNLLKSSRIIINEGWKSFWRKYKQYREDTRQKSPYIKEFSHQEKNKSSDLKMTSEKYVHFITPRKFKILYIIGTDPNFPSNRYRVYNFEEYLSEFKIMSNHINQSDILNKFDEISSFDIIVIFRSAIDESLEKLIEFSNKSNIPIIFDIDDYVFEPEIINVKNVDGIRFLPEKELSLYFDGVRRYRKALLLCDYFTTTTEYLAERGKELGKKTFVIRNGLNKEIIQVCEKAKENYKKTDNFVRIGYFSGTKTHQKDFATAIGGIRRILNEYSNVKLLISGHLDLNEFSELDKFKDKIEILPFVPWQELPFNMIKADINIVPLEVENPFCEAKSELKYFEAALLKIPTVASPTDVFRRAIKDGNNGFLAKDENEWYIKLKNLVEEEELRHKIGEGAYIHSLEEYSSPNMGKILLETYKKIILDYRKGLDINEKTLSMSFVIPPPFAGSGGHRNIFKAAKYLSNFGHFVKIYSMEDPGKFNGSKELRDYISANFFEPNFEIILGTGKIAYCDALFATQWSTSDIILKNKHMAAELFYFIQDYEPLFYPMSEDYIKADNTYRLGFNHISLGPWCARIIKEKHNVSSDWIPFPHIDKNIYYPRQIHKNNKKRIVYFSRPEMPRRCFGLGIDALNIFNKNNPDVEIVLFGSNNINTYNIRFPYLNLGVLPPEKLGELYSGSDIGLAFSTTNPSAVPFEMMSCGCPVVDLDYTSNYINYGNKENAMLVEISPEEIADGIEKLLRDDVLRRKISQNAIKYADTLLSEEESFKKLNEIILKKFDTGIND